MNDAVKKAMRSAMEGSRTKVDGGLVDAILALQRRHQFDETPDRRMQEMEKLVIEWCDSTEGSSDENS